MAARIVLFGATGFTGELTARALAARGAAPLLAGRGRDRLERLAAELGGLETAVADAARPASLRALLGRGDVLVTTVGPFQVLGRAAVDAAVGAGAHYLDSTGEGAFVRAVFDRDGPRAEAAGCALVPAFGFDFVPGNLSAELALRQAPEASGVEVAYVAPGAAASGGTQASGVGIFLSQGFAFRGGRLVAERMARRVLPLDWDGRTYQAVSLAGSEHLALPRRHPGLRDVDVYLAWSRTSARPLRRSSAALAAGRRLPGARRATAAVVARAARRRGSSGGPDATRRARARCGARARALDAGGATLAEVRLAGGDPYELTAALLAWGAERAASGQLQATGPAGPVEAFGLDELTAAATAAGLTQPS